MSQHIHDVHPNVVGRIPTDVLHQIEEKYNIVSHLPVIAGPIPPLDGLPIGRGFVECPECKRIYGKDGLRAHHSKVHSGLPRSHASSLRYVHAQQLNKGNNKSYFEVFPTSPSKPKVPDDDIISFLRKNRDSNIESYSPDRLDARVVTPWLRAVHWHEHVQPFSIDILRSLVEIPSKNDAIYGLKNGILNLFQVAYKIIPETDLLILQRLNTDDPLKGYVVIS